MYVIKIIHNYNIHTFNSYAMPEKENTKLSLYFKKETMNELTRLRDLLILTGLPSNELPDMNEFIDGIIAYSKNIIKEFPAERERLHEYSKGNVRKTTREDETETIETEEDEEITTESREYEEGSARFLYRITEEETERHFIITLSKGKLTGGKLLWIFGIRPKTYNNILEKTKSKVNKFNYMTAYSGLAMINGMIEKNIQSIPEALIKINTTKNYTAKRITDYISYLITLSDMINNNPEI